MHTQSRLDSGYSEDPRPQDRVNGIKDDALFPVYDVKQCEILRDTFRRKEKKNNRNKR